MEEEDEVALEELEEIVGVPLGIIELDIPLQWVQLPNDEPAVIVGMYDAFGELTIDTEEAVKLICKDRYGRLNAINVTNDLVQREVRLHS